MDKVFFIVLVIAVVWLLVRLLKPKRKTITVIPFPDSYKVVPFLFGKVIIVFPLVAMVLTGNDEHVKLLIRFDQRFRQFKGGRGIYVFINATMRNQQFAF